MLVLVDGDIVTYRVGFTTEDVDHQIACWRANEMVQGIVQATNAEQVRVFLTEESDPNAFRKNVYPEYKANRVKPRPRHYNAIRDFLEVQWKAEIIQILEADDAMAIAQCEMYNKGKQSVIASIDKDLKQIPGAHYDFVKGELAHVEPLDGIRHFYKQLLTGDYTDNIKGIHKIGPKTAEGMLANGDNESDWFHIVRTAYSNDDEMVMNGRVLWIWRNYVDDWKYRFETLKSKDEGWESSQDSDGD